MLTRLKNRLNKTLLLSISFCLSLCYSARANDGGFDEHVFIDSASFVLVAESQSSLASMFGHSFLKLEGRNKKHGLSYYNSVNSSILSYLNVIIGNSNGIYVLMPYDEMKHSYVQKEKRSLWEFRLKLSEQEREQLKALIKQLQGKVDKYNFFYNNCNSQIEALLASVNENFKYNALKGVKTPLEYAKYLTHANLVEEIVYIPSKKTSSLSKIYEYPAVTRFSTGYGRKGMVFNFYPIYHDKSQTINFEREVDSKIFGLNLLLDKKSNLHIENFDIFQLTAYDTITTSIDLGIEDNLRFKLGLGTSCKFDTLLLYAIPHMGLRHEKAFASMKVGATLKLLSIMSAQFEYEKGSDYDSVLAGMTFQLKENLEMQANYLHKKNRSNFLVSFGVYF